MSAKVLQGFPLNRRAPPRQRPQMSLGGDWFWRPRQVFRSAGEWARHTGDLRNAPTLPPAGSGPEEPDPERWCLALLPQGKVIADLRLVATRDNDVLGQVQALHGVADPAAHWTTRQRRWRLPQRLRGTAVTLASASGANYYHWLFDSLPRLRLLQLANLDWTSVDAFLVNEPPCRFVEQSFEHLGIPASRLVRCSKRRVLSADQLWVPPMPTPQEAQVAPWVCDFLRQAFVPPQAPDRASLRLYLSRRNSHRRRLANEDAVESLAVEFGFQILRPEELSFRDQVRLFSQADVVCGPHGAAFANLVFAPPGTRVLELFHPQHQAANYEAISRLGNLEHHRLVGEAPYEPGRDLDEHLGPYTISLDHLRAALDDLIQDGPARS